MKDVTVALMHNWLKKESKLSFERFLSVLIPKIIIFVRSCSR